MRGKCEVKSEGDGFAGTFFLEDFSSSRMELQEYITGQVKETGSPEQIL